jgi:hypothetical protein
MQLKQNNAIHAMSCTCASLLMRQESCRLLFCCDPWATQATTQADSAGAVYGAADSAKDGDSTPTDAGSVHSSGASCAGGNNIIWKATARQPNNTWSYIQQGSGVCMGHSQLLKEGMALCGLLSSVRQMISGCQVLQQPAFHCTCLLGSPLGLPWKQL